MSEYYIAQNSKKRHRALDKMLDEYGMKETEAMLKRMHKFYSDDPFPPFRANVKHASNDLKYIKKRQLAVA